MEIEEEKFNLQDKRSLSFQEKKESLTIDDFEDVSKLCHNRLNELRLMEKRFDTKDKLSEAVLK